LFENISPKIIGISDGVGGNAGGELASQFLCERVLSLSEGNILYKATDLNESLLKYAFSINGKEKMAATFSAVVFGEDTRILHIGNTRIYAVQGSYLKQLTTDHTTYNHLKLRGLHEEAEHCNKSEIVSCFGGGTNKLFSPDSKIVTFRKILMTSDGIHDYVDIDSMEDIICSEKSNAEKCNEILNIASDNGSCDDMSIIFVW
jgi:protein phosphatase